MILVSVDAEPAVYDEEFADEVRQQLLVVDGVLVWVDPIHQGKTRTALDLLLREVAAGPWVSAHPDVIFRMGVKEVLYRTKHLGWGTDTYVYRTIEEFASAFPPRLHSFGPRVIKQNRGNGGQGVWKVEVVRGEPAPFACFMQNVAACPKNWHFGISSRAASPISAGVGA